jgi:hypothetical protein
LTAAAAAPATVASTAAIRGRVAGAGSFLCSLALLTHRLFDLDLQQGISSVTVMGTSIAAAAAAAAACTVLADP